MSCHQYLGENPTIFADWIKFEYLGLRAYDELKHKHETIKKWLKHEKEEMYQHFRSELKRFEAERAAGKTGVLRLIPYD